MELEKPVELKDWAYSSIKKAILNSELPEGQQLHIDRLAQEMKISRTPIREALIILEHEGLVSVSPRVGFFVKGISRHDIEELFELRALVEGYAAEKAAEHLEDADLEEIDQLNREGGKAVEQGELEKFLETEIELHSSIMTHAQNKHLLRMVRSLKDLTYRERRLSLESIENVRLSLAEHQRIIEALRKKNGKLAGMMMRKHLRNVKERLLALLETMEKGS